jgi:antitoxin component HigA of HigAB toxin-antitoxin module
MEQTKIEKIAQFLERPGINKQGLFAEIGIKSQYINLILSGKTPLTTKFYTRIREHLISYGYKE